MKLRAGSQGTGELSRKWGALKPCQPRQAPVPGRDTLQSPFREGLSGNGMLPVFLQHLPPPVGACGERNYGLFFPGF